MAKTEKRPKILPHTSYISIQGAPPVRWDSLSEEKKQWCMAKMSERLSKVMSEYYSNHMDEYARL